MRDHRDSMRNFHNMRNLRVVDERPSSDESGSDHDSDIDIQLSPDSD